jgi:hypothetical protein
MLREIGISESRARYLMSIGRSLNRLNSDDLPRSIDALYVLSRLDADEIEQHIETGTITPDMTIADARGLVNPQPAPAPAPAHRSVTILTDPETGDEIGRVVDLCIKHDTELVLEALDREGTTLDDFLATA